MVRVRDTRSGRDSRVPARSRARAAAWALGELSIHGRATTRARLSGRAHGRRSHVRERSAGGGGHEQLERARGRRLHGARRGERAVGSPFAIATNIQTAEDLAEYVGCIEGGYRFRSFAGDEGVGTLSGCEDQTAMICGRAGELVRYSFCPVRFEARRVVAARSSLRDRDERGRRGKDSERAREVQHPVAARSCRGRGVATGVGRFRGNSGRRGRARWRRSGSRSDRRARASMDMPRASCRPGSISSTRRVKSSFRP